MKRTLVGLSLTALAAAGCSSGGESGSEPSSGPPAPTAYQPAPTDDAANIAGHISGCTSVEAGAVGAGKKSGMLSTASCTLQGYTVIVDTYGSVQSVISNELVDDPVTYAVGKTWVAFLGDPGQTAADSTLQLQLTNDAGELTRRGLEDDTTDPAPLAAQKRISALVATSLSGKVAMAR